MTASRSCWWPSTAIGRSHRSVDGSARLARAEHQVWGIVVERLRERLAAPGRRDGADRILAAVAAHETDPYSAADELLATLAREEDR